MDDFTTADIAVPKDDVSDAGCTFTTAAPSKSPAAWVLGDEVMASHFATLESPGSGTHYLQGKRIPYENLKFETALSKGASGEIWACTFNGRKVAVKRLLQNKSQKADKVQTFAEEIELTASLTHPHIVNFIGMAWNSLNNLVMVLEYVPMGNLQGYLLKNGDLLSWARDKIHMAIGIAQALDYLHGHASPSIHRDLKSTNILLTRRLEPKLIDFGVSRGAVDLTMTAGVGTPYWTAPEVLEARDIRNRRIFIPSASC
ncbi:hypothetical protein V7S43_014199 [Phytophthora oleae]|uniref:Protein kinase domain-containing protein n=1 Tax=Phytophthora oleae TaxID=2107226 RepID=A0ABD3F1V4_9STRA